MSKAEAISKSYIVRQIICSNTCIFFLEEAVENYDFNGFVKKKKMIQVTCVASKEYIF